MASELTFRKSFLSSSSGSFRAGIERCARMPVSVCFLMTTETIPETLGYSPLNYLTLEAASSRIFYWKCVICVEESMTLMSIFSLSTKCFSRTRQEWPEDYFFRDMWFRYWVSRFRLLETALCPWNFEIRLLIDEESFSKRTESIFTPLRKPQSSTSDLLGKFHHKRLKKFLTFHVGYFS